MKTLQILFFFLIITISSCSQESSDNSNSYNIWESNFHDFYIEYNSSWSIIEPTLDTKEKLLFAIIDNSDGKSYVVKIAPDLHQNMLSNKNYYQSTKEQMLAANPKNKLIQESEKYLHGKEFHEQTYLMYTKKWGLLKQHALIHRTGKKMFSIQYCYPIKSESDANIEIPLEIIKLDGNVKF